MYIGLPSLGLRSSSAGFSPASLFAAGEQGGWYDPSDMSTMFQDVTLTTPAAIESPVGIIMDKRAGLPRGANQITNGDFSSGSTGWNVGSEWSVGSGTASFLTTGATSAFNQSFAIPANTMFEVSFEIVSLSSGAIIRFGFGTTTVSFTTIGVKTFYLYNNAATFSWYFDASTSIGKTGSIRNISAKAVAGNHLIQATAASRPTLSARYNTATKTELLTDVAWSTGGGSVAVTGGVSDPRGGLLAFTLTGTGGAQNFWQPTASTGKTTQYKIWIRRRTGTGVINLWNTDNGSNTNIGPSLTSSWQLFSSTPTVQAATGVQFTFGTLGDAIDVAFPDVRTSADWALNIPAYQRVDTATSYDTSGFPMYLNFDGVDDRFTAAANVNMSGSQKMTVWHGASVLSNSAYSGMFALAAPTTTSGAVLTWSRITAGQLEGNLNGVGVNPAIVTENGGTVAPRNFVWSVALDNTLGTVAQEVVMRINGATPATTASGGPSGTGLLANGPLEVGSYNAGNFFAGRMYQLIYRGGVSTAAQIASGERFTGSKMGISL